MKNILIISTGYILFAILARGLFWIAGFDLFVRSADNAWIILMSLVSGLLGAVAGDMIIEFFLKRNKRQARKDIKL